MLNPPYKCLWLMERPWRICVSLVGKGLRAKGTSHFSDLLRAVLIVSICSPHTVGLDQRHQQVGSRTQYIAIHQDPGIHAHNRTMYLWVSPNILWSYPIGSKFVVFANRRTFPDHANISRVLFLWAVLTHEKHDPPPKIFRYTVCISNIQIHPGYVVEAD